MKRDIMRGTGMRRNLMRGLLWQGMLMKRLLKKPVFLGVLCLIPILAFGMSILTEEESGVVRVALYANDEDGYSQRVISGLMEAESVILFTRYPDKTSAVDAVRNGKADSAWGFAEDLTNKIERYAGDMDDAEPLVEIVEREENITLQLARERIYGELITVLSKEICQAYLKLELGFDPENNREIVDQYYDSAKMEHELVNFRFIDTEKTLVDINYLSTPLRGMIAVIMLICGISAGMVFLGEKEKGIYSGLGKGKQMAVLMASCFGACGCCVPVALAALYLSGNFSGLSGECGMMVLYLLACVPFCTLLAMLFRKASALAVFLPVLTVIVLVFCPVFINHQIGQPIRYCLPTYYYLHGVAENGYIREMLIYIASCMGACMLVGKAAWKKEYSIP